MTLTKSDIVEDLNNEIGLNKREAKELVDSLFDNIKNKSPRRGRNPRTGEDVEITARKVVTFKSGQKLKEAVKTLSNDSE